MSDSGDAGQALSDSDGDDEPAGLESEDSEDDCFELRPQPKRGRPPKKPAAASGAQTPAGPAKQRGGQKGAARAAAGLDPGSADTGGPRQRQQADAF